MKIDSKYIVGFLGAVVLVIAMAIVFDDAPSAKGSVVDGQGYNSTTTSSVVATTWTEARTLTPTTTSVGGTLGSVIITKQTQVTTLNIYDATTTNVNLRTGNLATSSILLASFGTSTPVGTYVFDTKFQTGLIVDPTPIGGGMVASSTITWK